MALKTEVFRDDAGVPGPAGCCDKTRNKEWKDSRQQQPAPPLHSAQAEYFRFQGHTFSTTGLGAVISHATDTGNFSVLLAATVVMAAMVVTVNRLVWRRLYALASTKFKLEG